VVRSLLAAPATLNFFSFAVMALYTLYATRTLGVRPTLLVAVAGAVASVLWLLPSPVVRLRALPEA
jgi:hypothetical protein